jgi:spore germination protein
MGVDRKILVFRVIPLVVMAAIFFVGALWTSREQPTSKKASTSAVALASGDPEITPETTETSTMAAPAQLAIHSTSPAQPTPVVNTIPLTPPTSAAQIKTEVQQAQTPPITPPIVTPTPAPVPQPETPVVVPEPTPVPEPQPEPAPEAQPTPRKKEGIVVWMHRNDWAAARATVAAHGDLIAEVSPAWYEVDAEGRVRQRSGASVNDASLLRIVREKNITLRPLVMNVTGVGSHPDLVLPVLRDEALRKRHIQEIKQLVLDNGYDGIDLDYEGITLSDLPHLATLVEELAAELHAEGKTLAVSIETQPNDKAIASWRRIGAAADNVRLMAYGHQHATPQPIVDPVWLRERLGRALRAIPADKLTHGIPTYCHVWREGQQTGSGTWENLLRPSLSTKNINRDPATKTPSYRVVGEEVWCEDAESIQTKMAIGEELGIHQFALWRIGGEDQRIWTTVASR